MNGYELHRNWFDWAFENPEKVTPGHTAVYLFAVEWCNRLAWKDKFGFPSQMAMDAVGIRKHETFSKYFNDLIVWGFINLIQKSKNQYSANIISLKSAVPKNGKALEKAILWHGGKQPVGIGESTGESKGSIDKPETSNLKQETNTYASLVFMFEEFRKKYPGTKRGAEAEIESFKKKYKDWMKIIPLLIPCLENQIKVKKTMTDKNIFVPQWAHLQTFLNQRKWEEFQEVPADVNKFNLFGKEEKGVMTNVW
jgi:hypothetical protein